jgi:hypothetical protein
MVTVTERTFPIRKAAPDFILTEEILHQHTAEAVGEGYAIERFPPVPISQVVIDWVVRAARAVYPIIDLDNESMGTAFYMDRSFITCRHCAPDPKMETAGVMAHNNLYVLKGVPRMDSKDDAIRIYANFPYPGLELPIASPKHLDQFLILGYPGTLSIEDGPYVTWNGLVSRKESFQLHSLNSIPGNSGSPVLTYERNLIGIWARSDGFVPVVETGLF